MIEKIKNISIEKLIFISIMFLLIVVPVFLIYYYTCFRLNIHNIFLIDRSNLLWGCVPVLFVLYVLDLIFNKKKITFIDGLMYLLIILGIISSIFAVDVNTSIYGEVKRNEGLLSLLSYYFILLNLKNMSNEKYKRIIVKTIVIIGIVQIIYCLLQVYTNASFVIHSTPPNIAFGLCGHPNFFGSYMVILASFMFSMYMLDSKRKYLILSLIFFMGICFSSSTGPLLSFLLMIVFFSIAYRKRIKWKNFIKIILLFISFYFFVDISVRFVHNNILNHKVKSNYYMSSMIKDFNTSNFGNGRIEIWKDSLPLLKKYWLVGAGLDNFGKVYGIKNNMYYDKAHNVYLQIAITNGVFALAVYLALLAIIFFKGLKIKDTMYISLLAAFIGYCIQAFANISVVEVAPTFFVICGLLLSKIQNTKDNNVKGENRKVLIKSV